MHRAHAALLLLVVVGAAFRPETLAAPAGPLGKLTGTKAAMQDTSLHQPGISDDYVYAATSSGSSSSSSADEADIDSSDSKTQDSSSALPASVSPDDTVSQDSSTQETYGEQCLAMKEDDVCLQEIVRRDCSLYNDGTIDISEMWTSEFSCCRKKGDYGEGDSTPGGSGLSRLWGSIKSMATCDWFGTYTTDLIVNTGVTRRGTVTATCYFSSDTEQCGGPFCDKSMLSLQGTLHSINAAYRFWGQSNTNQDAGCTANWPNGRLAQRGGNATADEAAQRAKFIRSRRGTLSLGKPAAWSRVNAAAAGYHNGAADQDVYVGAASVINGMITAVAGPRKDKFAEGAFEYTPYFELDTTAGANPVGAIDASKPWVRDNTLQITFYRHQDQYY